MKIGILGWYYQDNAGDDRILECIRRKINTFGIIETKVFVAWEDLNTKIDQINSCDFLLVGGGGLILRNTNRLVPLFETITTNWGFFGVSVDSVGADNELFINYIAENSKFILVRDSYSSNVFKPYKNASIYQAPDLTFLYPFQPDPNSSESASVALSLRPWKPNPFKQFTKNYHRFNHLVHKLPLLTELLGLWNEQKFVSIFVKNTNLSIRPFPLHISDKSSDTILLSKYFKNASDISKFDIKLLQNSHYLVGMRLHALIFATQLGVPFIALNYASKVKNYSDSVGMSDFVLDLKHYKKIKAKVTQLELKKHELSQRLLATSERFENEVHEVVDTLFNTYIL